MNARKIQITFVDATPVAPVTLHSLPSIGVRSGDFKEWNLGPNPGHTIAGAIREKATPLHFLLAAEKLVSGQAHPIQWGINE